MRVEAALLRRDIRNSVGQPLDHAQRGSAQLGLSVDTREPAMPHSISRSHRSLEASAEAFALRSGQNPRSGTEPPTPAAATPTAAFDFTAVRLHSDGHAKAAAHRLKARAFTIGMDIFIDPSLTPPAPQGRHGLIAHELAHVMQQRQLGKRLIQPRLIATGSDADIQRFIAIAEPAMGEQLQHDAVTNEITVVGALAAHATSPAFAAAMHRIIDDPVQDAEANFGVG